MSVRRLQAALSVSVLSFVSLAAVACSGGAESASSAATTGVATSTQPGVAAAKADSVAAPAAPAIVKTSASFTRYTVTPDGRIDGMLLSDGTAVRVPPHGETAASLSTLVAGDAVTVEGRTVQTKTGAVVMHPIVRKGDVVLADYSALPEPGNGGPRGRMQDGPPPGEGGPRGGPRHGFGGPGFGGPGMDKLTAVTSTGTVSAILSHHDRIEAVIMSDGTTAHLPRGHHGSEVAIPAIALGDELTLEGRGATSTYGKGMFVLALTPVSGEKVVLAPEPPAVTPLETSGKITRVLTSPFGGVDAILLGDGTAVRVPPFASADKLTVGTTVKISGETIGSMAHARTITSSSGETLLAMPAPTDRGERVRDHAPPARVELTALEESSTIAQVLSGPRGVDTLVLSDGAVVKLHPEMAAKIASSLVVGTPLSITGKGGTYTTGTSLFADTIKLPSGETVSAPARPDHGPGGPGGAPCGEKVQDAPKPI